MPSDWEYCGISPKTLRRLERQGERREQLFPQRRPHQQNQGGQLLVGPEVSEELARARKKLEKATEDLRRTTLKKAKKEKR